MSGAGDPEPVYVLARQVLLDVLEALGEQRDAIVLVGAQAIYLHTGEAELAVALYTTDADILIDPVELRPSPKLEEILRNAGFRRTPEVGIWATSRLLGDVPTEVTVDFLVPELVGGGGRRAARLGEHGSRVARKARGLEAALVDRAPMLVTSLGKNDARSFHLAVAGPTALLVAKVYKIQDRAGSGRADDKDALDVLRLLRAIPTGVFTSKFKVLLADDKAAEVTREALEHLKVLFSEPTDRGSQMAARAAAPMEDNDSIAASCAMLAHDLLRAVQPLPAAGGLLRRRGR